MVNESGDFAASKSGDLSHPLAEREAPDAEEVVRCGSGELRAGIAPALLRAPYLQRVSDSGSRILWTAEPGEAQEVRILQKQSAFTPLARAPPPAVVDGAEPEAGAFEYEVTVDQLEPDTIYCYQLASSNRSATEPAGFRTAPSPEVGAKVSFVALGDSGSGGADQQAIAEQLGTVAFRLLIHTGGYRLRVRHHG